MKNVLLHSAMYCGCVTIVIVGSWLLGILASPYVKYIDTERGADIWFVAIFILSAGLYSFAAPPGMKKAESLLFSAKILIPALVVLVVAEWIHSISTFHLLRSSFFNPMIASELVQAAVAAYIPLAFLLYRKAR